MTLQGFLEGGKKGRTDWNSLESKKNTGSKNELAPFKSSLFQKEFLGGSDRFQSMSPTINQKRNFRCVFFWNQA